MVKAFMSRDTGLVLITTSYTSYGNRTMTLCVCVRPGRTEIEIYKYLSPVNSSYLGLGYHATD